MQKIKILFFVLSLSLIFIAVAGHGGGEDRCECSHDRDGENKSGARKYKIAAIPSVLVAGIIGVLFPLLGNVFPSLRPETPFFFVTRAFAAGVILSTGFLHVLPEAFEMLTSPCLSEHPWEFPFTGFIAMMAAIFTLSVDAFATSYIQKSHFKNQRISSEGEGKEGGGELGLHVHARAHSQDGHTAAESGVGSAVESKTQLLRSRVIAQVLELGIIVHSVVIGISLGASQDPDTAKTLFAALMFHQCFEGLGLGGCITQGKFKWMAAMTMAMIFSVTTPIGIAVGMGISSSYDESSPTALIVQGVLNAASSGILIYMSLVDLLAADFMHPKVQSNSGLQIMAHISLLLGAGIMSLLAKWA
ncbi:PREDICTED: zinc transporter 3-like [Tarenaya hassleriana]|uniref:zinc transporter 3-like n=1 Tax=Tarenaya hassleriana TaxID=28532 RepID=UPI00053C9F5F|nr:PREDICTED: zinc transporter 3-like [Tarenaya hassleriana]